MSLRDKSRNLAGIANDQHVDSSGAQKNLGGTVAAFDSIISGSNTLTPIQKRSVLRVANTSASFQFLYIGSTANAPAGAPDVTSGLALPPNSVDVVFTDDTDNLAIKSSASTVQVALIKP